MPREDGILVSCKMNAKESECVIVQEMMDKGRGIPDRDQPSVRAVLL
jgi:hypothetical protein